MRHKNINFKQAVLLLCFMLSAVLCGASGTNCTDGFSHINVKVAHVQGAPKSSSIQASISGHYLSVSFTENIGQVTIEMTTSTGATVDYLSMQTPNGYLYYIPNTGDYIITFTLSNGDEYYGEFSVTD